MALSALSWMMGCGGGGAAGTGGASSSSSSGPPPACAGKIAFSAADHATTPEAMPRGLAVGDVNGDGKPDLIVANTNSNTVGVFLNLGQGTFTPQATYPAGDLPFGIAVGDLDGDGLPDLAIANYSSGVTVLRNLGNGLFAAPVTTSFGSILWSIVVGDLDGDGKLDIAVTRGDHASVSVLSNKGDGTFGAPVDVAVAEGPVAIAIGDLDGDGKPDLATGNLGDHNVSVLLNQGKGAFAPHVDYDDLQVENGGTAQTPAVTLVDLDGDGRLDLVAANIKSSVFTLRNQGKGALVQSGHYVVSPATTCEGIASGDLDGDGRQDIVVIGSDANTVSVMVNKGDGTLAEGLQFSASMGGHPHAVVVDDLDADGRPDVAVVSAFTDVVQVMLTTCAP